MKKSKVLVTFSNTAVWITFLTLSMTLATDLALLHKFALITLYARPY